MARADASSLTRVGDPAAVERLVQELEQRLDDIVERIVDQQRAEIPSYAAAPPSIVEEVRTMTRDNIRACVLILKGELDFGTVDAVVAASARTRAKQGFPLHDELMTYMVGARVFWEAIQDLARDEPGAWAELLPTGIRLTLEMLQHVTTAISAAYLDVEETRIADEEHELQTLVETLAGVRQPDQWSQSRAARRGIDVRKLPWCAVTQTSDDAAAEQVRVLRRTLDGGPVGRIERCIVAYVSNDEPPALPVGTPVGLARSDDPHVAFRRAQAAFQVARYLGRDSARYEEVMPLAVVFERDPEDRADFVRTQLGPALRDPSGDELLKSLQVFYRCGQSVAAAARELHVHRHTLEYRLERLAGLLGTDVRDPSRRLFLELALALRE